MTIGQTFIVDLIRQEVSDVTVRYSGLNLNDFVTVAGGSKVTRSQQAIDDIKLALTRAFDVVLERLSFMVKQVDRSLVLFPGNLYTYVFLETGVSIAPGCDSHHTTLGTYRFNCQRGGWFEATK